MIGRGPVSWTVLEQRLRARPRWRRVGREWHGPCPVRGAGKDTCWFRPGASTPIAAGCRHCGGRLSSADFRAHLRAVVGDCIDVVPGGGPPENSPSRPRSERVHPLPGRVWAAGRPVDAGPPGLSYLRWRGVVARGDVLPPSVRWLPARQAALAGCRPSLPAAAAGALLYRFAGPGEEETCAIQFEAVDPAGRRLPCTAGGRPVERASAVGSVFAAGRRVFEAAPGVPAQGCWVVEGPLDALALLRLAALGLLELCGAAVFGVAGAPAGFTPRACWAPGPVRVAPDGDRAGLAAAVRLGVGLARLRRRFAVRRAPSGMDWSDWARESALERAGLGDSRFRKDVAHGR